MECENESGSNEDRILEKVHELFNDYMGKKYELEHWYEILKEQPNWKKICFSTQTASGSKSCKPDSVGPGDESGGGVSSLTAGKLQRKRQTKD